MALPAPHPGAPLFRATVPAPALLWALRLLKATTSGTTTRSPAILRHLWLRTPSAHSLELRATDLTTYTTIRLPVVAEELTRAPDVGLAVPLRALEAFLQRSKDPSVATVTLEAATPQTLGVAAIGYTELTLLDARDFPGWPEPPREGKAGHCFGDPAGVWAERLTQLVTVASDDPSRLVLQGAHLKPGGTSYECAATDGHRLVRLRVPAPDGHQPARAVTLPAGGLTVVKVLAQTVAAQAKAAKRVEAATQLVWTVAPTDGFTFVTTAGPLGAVTVAIRPIEGEFPDYAQVIPAADKQTAGFVAKRKPLLAALARLALVLERGEKKVGITTTLLAGGDEISLVAGGSQRKGRERVPTTASRDLPRPSADCAFSMNVHYWRDAVAAFTSPTVDIRFAVEDVTDEHGGTSPGVVSPVLFTDPADDAASTLVVVMPMRI